MSRQPAPAARASTGHLGTNLTSRRSPLWHYALAVRRFDAALAVRRFDSRLASIIPAVQLSAQPASTRRMPLAEFPRIPYTSEFMAHDSGPRGLVTLICLTCGNEKSYDESVPSAVTCERCGGTVFRTFATPTEPDEASIAQLEEQARSISFGDASPDTGPGDVRDLDTR